MHGLCQLWQHLSEHHFTPILMTRRLKQVALENFFGVIRQQGGNCDNPTSFQLVTRAFRKLFVDNYLTPPATGKCADDLDAYVIGSHPNKPNPPEDMPSSDQTSAAHITTVYDTDYKTNEIEQNLLCKNALICVIFVKRMP